MRVMKSFLISLAVLIALPALLFGLVQLSGQKQVTHYSGREVLRAIYESAAWMNPESADIPAMRRKAFLSKIAEGSERGEVYRKLAADRIGCLPAKPETKAAKVECMTAGHTYDFRWQFVLYFSDDNKLLDARIDTLKGG